MGEWSRLCGNFALSEFYKNNKIKTYLHNFSVIFFQRICNFLIKTLTYPLI